MVIEVDHVIHHYHFKVRREPTPKEINILKKLILAQYSVSDVIAGINLMDRIPRSDKAIFLLNNILKRQVQKNANRYKVEQLLLGVMSNFGDGI